ncbi:MAG: exodeoxyribonuclease V subunit gamma, partial [Deltaproteobacteria bacterium]|nr:exodeoxyribonuclease V subunit gamma [Deltaproteobacteria bacterium]
MAWRIMSCLPRLMQGKGFEGIRQYVRGKERDLRLLQLSIRIADIFDQYLLYRPEMVFRWERGEEDLWQAVLWRELATGGDSIHRAALARLFFQTIERSPERIKGLPERVSIFGISSLPRFHVQVLSSICRVTRVNVFLMNPCKEYWGDILADREMKRITRKRVLTPSQQRELHLEKGNSLLASMGRLGRDFLNLFSDLDVEEMETFEDPGGRDLLSWIQSDILNLRNPGREREVKRRISSDDESIRIHSCHSPMREVEVLYDQILSMFERDPSLEPKDILVMTPDIEVYTPYIQAVFDVPEQEICKIPYTIADRNIRNESKVIEPFMRILDLADSRVGVSRVMAILESGPVLRKFDLKESHLELIRKWLAETGIRWGIDEKTREMEGLPRFRNNTWAEGIERLLLGYAMPGRNERLFSGVLPYDNIEGSGAQVLGGFLEFVERLFGEIRSLREKRGLRDWAEIMSRILDEFFMPDEETERDLQAIRDMINDLQEIGDMDPPVFEGEMDLKAIRWYLENSMERKGLGFGFMSGGVTFCAMLPMRSIPFRVICLLGMDGDAYPRESQHLSFDLVAQHPKPGDRSRRLDDRYLFLEALLSARERFYISYVGQSIKDNSVMPPSVLVSELTDYIEQGFQVEGEDIMEHVLTRHRIQPFNPEYFDGGAGEKYFSYSETNCQAAKKLLTERMDRSPFIETALKDPGEEWHTVDVEDLCRFFGNPCRFLLSRRLGIFLEEERPLLEEREPFEINPLERYLLGEEMLRRRISGRDLGSFFQVAKAAGRFPPGTVGECVYEKMERSVEAFYERLVAYLGDRELEILDVDLEISGFRVVGKIQCVPSAGYILFRFGKVRAKDRLKAWINNLLLHACTMEWQDRGSLVAGWVPKESKWSAFQYPPLREKSEAMLFELLDIFREGLVRPIHFFPEPSFEYAQRLLVKKKSENDALEKARGIWVGNEHQRGEMEDPYQSLCFRKTDPLDREFESLAVRIFGPLLEHEKVLK